MNEGHRKSLVTLAILVVLAVVIWAIAYFSSTKKHPVQNENTQKAALDSLQPQSTESAALNTEQKKAINSASAPTPTKNTPQQQPNQSVLDSLQ